MFSFSFILFIILLVLVLNLQGRVKKLEKSLISTKVKEISKAKPEAEPLLAEKSPMTASVDQKLLGYINSKMTEGKSQSSIKQTLINNSWKPKDIDQAFEVINFNKQAAAKSPIAQRKEESGDRLLAWIKEDWLLKLGALLLLIGFGWLTTYAFSNNLIGPMGRIVLGIVAGTLFLAFGFVRMKKFVQQGGVFLILGSTTILLTTFAAREIYNFFTPASALALMFLSTAFVAFTSIKYKRPSLALASLILAGIAPLLTSSPSPDFVSLFAYLFVVVLGAIWIVALTGKRELTTAALILIALYSLPHILSPGRYADPNTLLLFAYAFAALFFITNTIGILKSKGVSIKADLITATGNGLLLIAWIMALAPKDFQSLIIAGWMVVFTVGAFLIFKITQRREPFYVYAGVAIAMLAAATSAELRGATLTIAYIIESGVIAMITYAVLKDIRIASRMSLLLVGPALLAFQSMNSGAWRSGVLHSDFFVLLVLGLTLIASGLFFLKSVRESQHDEPKQINAGLLIAGSIYLYILLWLSLHASLLSNSTAVMVALAFYTIIGLAAYFVGAAKEKKVLEIYGGLMVGFVVIRLLTVDVWSMVIAGRIATFFLIGALLISTAFLSKKNK